MKLFNTIHYMGLLLGCMITVACTQSSGDGGSGGDGSGANSGKGGSMARFTISGDFLYTVGQDQLKLFDISTPDQPKYLSTRDQRLNFGIETIFVQDTLLFIGSNAGFYIYDISRPGFPQRTSFTSHISSCDPVVANGKYAYVTLNTKNVWCGITNNELQVYDISDPRSPKLVMSERGVMSPMGLGVSGNRLFLCDNGIKVYDLSNPAAPRWMGDLSDLSEADGMEAFDVIPLQSTLLMIGPHGLFQFSYLGDKMKFVSKIPVSKLINSN